MARKRLESGKFKSSWQKRPSCFSNVMASEVGVEDWKKFGGVMRVFFVKSIGQTNRLTICTNSCATRGEVIPK